MMSSGKNSHSPVCFRRCAGGRRKVQVARGSNFGTAVFSWEIGAYLYFSVDPRSSGCQMWETWGKWPPAGLGPGCKIRAMQPSNSI